MSISELRKLKIEDIKSSILLCCALISVLFKKKKNIWLLVERVAVADDNAWMFYKWLRYNHSNIDAYFLLDKKASNFDTSDSHMVAWNSLKHYELYVLSSLYIMATFNTPRPNPRVCSFFEYLTNKKIRKVYLKHGITVSGMEQHCYALHHFRLYLCGALPEYNFVKEVGGYPEGNVKYTGFARFDELYENQKKGDFILLIPTWRKYIGCDSTLSPEKNEKIFLNSEYYKRYSSLLKNQKLIAFLTENNIKLCFCIHAEYRKFLKCFCSNNPRIEIVSEKESIHDLLIHMGMLITDYSSVFFDAAYIGKPVIYYQFDYQEFRAKHLSEGYFSFERDGMGPVINDESDLVSTIISYYKNNVFVREPLYEERSNRFFPLRDAQNCERIYNEIISLKN